METRHTLDGILERVVYRSEAEGSTVARLLVPGRKNPATIAGNILSVNPGEPLRLTWKWVLHTMSGEQFQVERCLSDKARGQVII